jgi:hypothetical protein
MTEQAAHDLFEVVTLYGAIGVLVVVYFMVRSLVK